MLAIVALKSTGMSVWKSQRTFVPAGNAADFDHLSSRNRATVREATIRRPMNVDDFGESRGSCGEQQSCDDTKWCRWSLLRAIGTRLEGDSSSGPTCII